MDFREFVKMKRALAGPDGKSRSKGSPSADGKKTQGVQNRYRSFLRPTQPRVPHKTAANENKKQEPKMSARQSRLVKGYKAAQSHFKKVTEKIRGRAEKAKENRARKLPKSNWGQISKHAMKQRAVDAGSAARKQTRVKQNIPAPAPKRGR